MAKNIRYYITCDDDRPVVHTIPVSVRTDEALPDARTRVDTDTSPRNEPQVPARVAKLVRSAVRRAPADS